MGGVGNGAGGPRTATIQPPATDRQETDPGAAPTVDSISAAAQNAIDACDLHDPKCIADSLDSYAAALRRIAPQLPPRLQNLPDIVAGAATRVRAAKTKAEAVKAVTNAIAVVHKTIALLKADDPIIFKTETREGAFVAATLQVAQDKLEKAVGL